MDSKETGEFLKTFVQKNDLILVKGLQGMRMERAVESILLDKKIKKSPRPTGRGVEKEEVKT